MSFKTDGLQVAEYVYDFAVDGGATGAIDLSAKSGYAELPIGAVVLDVGAWVETACVGATMTLDVGNTNDDDGYMVDIAVAALTGNSIHRAGSVAGALLWDDTNDHYLGHRVDAADDGDFIATIVTAALTAGKIRFFVTYYFPTTVNER